MVSEVLVFVFAGHSFRSTPDLSIPRQAWRWLDDLDVGDRVLVARRLGLPPSEDLELDLEVALSEALDRWAMIASLRLDAAEDRCV